VNQGSSSNNGVGQFDFVGFSDNDGLIFKKKYLYLSKN